MPDNVTQLVLELAAQLNQTRVELAAVRLGVSELKDDVDHFFLVQMSVIVFGLCPSSLLFTYVEAMQLGFGFLEAGNLHSKHVTNMLMKVVMDSLLAALGWWAVGYAFAFGDRTEAVNGFIGTKFFFGTEFDEEPGHPTEPHWFFYWTFCSACATIVSGRCKFQAYLGYTALLSMWIFPLPVHWLWSQHGWLNPFNNDSPLPHGAIDFAGGCVVHLVGGVSAFVGAAIIGPQTNRFTSKWDGAGEKGRINSGRSMWTALGTFLLWFGWYGFNIGSINRITGGRGNLIGRIGMNTTLAGAGGSLLPLLLNRWLYKSWDINVLMNGILSGLVSITSSCAFVPPWAAFLTGLLAGPIYFGIQHVLIRFKVDDPLVATGIHAGCGAWAMFCGGLFARQSEVHVVYGEKMGDHFGAVLGGNGKLLGLNCLAVIIVASWSALWATLYFGITKYFGVLRISLEEEKYGLDVTNHMRMTKVQRYAFKMADENSDTSTKNASSSSA